MSVICNNVHQSTNLLNVCNVHGLDKVKKVHGIIRYSKYSTDSAAYSI